jgi:cardiolipin synthase
VSGSLRQIPNVITSIRILLIVPIAVSLAHHRLELAIALFGVAALSDAADGFLAKRFGWQSELGAVLDPIADKLLMATAFVTLAYLRLVPIWLTAIVIARDVIIVVGALLYRYWLGPLSARPSAVSKLNTLCQAAFILAVVGREGFSVPSQWLLVLLGALTFATVMISGIDYVLVYGRLALRTAGLRTASSRTVERVGDRRP